MQVLKDPLQVLEEQLSLEEQVMECCEMLEQVMECCEMLKSHLT